jgi:NAD-dependent dihydropyrimidine dehydrogenase PreA subunit
MSLENGFLVSIKMMKRISNSSICSDIAKKLMPIVNFNSCGCKEDCVAVCPYNVFEVRPISKKDKATLNLKGQIKTFFYPGKAYVINPEQCHACGLCVQACPEKAIKLAGYFKADR